MEIWKDIAGFEGKYQVSNKGRVKRLVGYCVTHDFVMKLNTKKAGYKYISLSDDSLQRKHPHVHRLVAEAFIPNPNNYPIVNHLNCVKDDNCVENLEWCTHKENQIHARRNIVFNFVPPTGAEHPRTFPVIQKDMKGNVLHVWDTAISPAKHYGIKPSSIMVAAYTGGSSVGYLWKRAERGISVSTGTPPPKIVFNTRLRDMSKAVAKRLANIEAITQDQILEHGIKCFQQYGSIERHTWEVLYSRTNKTYGYDLTRNKFGGFIKFQKAVLDKLGIAYIENQRYVKPI